VGAASAERGACLHAAFGLARPLPVAATLAVVTASGVLVVLAAPHQPPFELFIADVLVALGAHTAGRRRWIALGLMFAVGLPFMVAAHSRGMALGNTLSPVAWLLGAWVVGSIIRGRRVRTSELEALTRELAAQRELQPGRRSAWSAAGSRASCTTSSPTTSR